MHVYMSVLCTCKMCACDCTCVCVERGWCTCDCTCVCVERGWCACDCTCVCVGAYERVHVSVHVYVLMHARDVCLCAHVSVFVLRAPLWWWPVIISSWSFSRWRRAS